ncbi:DUF2798 domain-containing protein [Vibrio sp. T187]|uniref:DUF2798 domain-containing protein n=1 Tax=Vibrio TaxID=662 RepID=UPI0010C94E61|nr:MULTISPECIES: DUF2798 domain-containing protein [Vibrio]MBW3695227.1 DUF2798 domain-containing protein [Vibrio sp. T187]
MNKKQVWLNTFLSSFVMAAIMSGIISGTKMGFSAEWPPIWLQSFTMSWPCALVLGFTVLPLIRKFSVWATKPRPKMDSTSAIANSLEIAQLQGTQPITNQTHN